MLKLIKRLLCKHEGRTFVRNLYGDQIIHAGYKRSEWRCIKCGAWVWEDALHKEEAPQAKPQEGN